MANPATRLAWSSVTSTPGSVLAGWSGGGGGGAWPGTGVKPAGDLGLLYLVRHLGGPEPLHDEADGNDATESVHTYGGRLGWDYRGDINHQVLDNRWSVAWLCIGRF